MRVVAAGDALLAPSITRTTHRRLRPPTHRGDAPTHDSTSSPHANAKCSHAVARGLSNAELADELFMSHATAKTHVSHLLTKFAARDRAQLVVAAYETGLTTPRQR